VVNAPIWVRHPAAVSWCIADSFGANVVTLCNGRFCADEDYAVNADPPPITRCSRCETVWMRRTRVEAGLRELAANAPEPTRIEFDQLEDA